MASWKAARSAKFYLFCILAMIAAGWGVFYLHSARNQDIAAVREAKAIVADLGPRVEVVTTSAGPKERIIAKTADILREAGPTGHILNLGHGILPPTPVDNARAFIDFAKTYRHSK